MTEDIEAIANRLVVGHKRDGRSIYDLQARDDLVRASRQPGVSLARIAGTCGINANVQSNWVRQRERNSGRGSTPSGDVVEIPAASSFLAVQSDPLPPPPAPPPAQTLDVQARLPNGAVLDMRLTDLDKAVKLIEVFGRLRCSASTKP